MGRYLIYAAFLVAATMLTSAIFSNVNAQTITLTQKDNEAKQKIIGNLSDAVDHKYSRYDLIIGSLKGDNSTFVIYNATANQTIPPPVCGPGTHLENGKCVPDVPVCPPNQFFNQTSGKCEDLATPPPPSSGNVTKINLAGDYLGSGTIDAMNAKTADLNGALGDLGYKATLAGFKSDWNKLNNHKCIPGNHDQEEDGSAALAQESSAYCGDIWMLKVAGNSTLLVAVNTNGNLHSLLGTAETALMSTQFMDGVKNVVLMTHKPCETHPNSHHNPEGNVKTFCQSFDSKVPQGVKIYHISAHNHEIASTADGTKFLVGGGGQTSHRGCGTDSNWTFCKTQSGFLQLEIKDSGEIKGTFFNTNGGAIS
jgi:hypothetical protein